MGRKDQLPSHVHDSLQATPARQAKHDLGNEAVLPPGQPALPEFRRCNHCKKTKPISAFHKYREGRRFDCAVCRTAESSRYYQDNKEARQAYDANHYERNADRKRAAAKKWRTENPDRARKNGANSSQTRRARKAELFKEIVNRSVVFDRDGGVCHLCGLPVDTANWHLEHVTPLAVGGEHSYANTAVSHPLCNLSKGPYATPRRDRLAADSNRS